MASTDLLITNGTIVTMDPDRRILDGGAIAISGTDIVDVGDSASVRGRHADPARIIDATDFIVLPGLIDLHGHGGNLLTRTIGDHLTGAGWRTLMDFICYRATDAAWWHVEGLMAALERLTFGTTTSLFMLGTAPRGDDPVFAVTQGEAYEAVGVRACIGVGPSRPPWPRTFSDWVDGERIDRVLTMEDSFEATAQAIRQWGKRDSSLVEMWVSVSRFLNPNRLDPMYHSAQDAYIRPQAEGVRRLMDELGVKAHIHAYGNAIEFAYEQDLGLLGPDVVLAHCTGVTEYDEEPYTDRSIRILKETDTRVAHNPRSRRIYSYDGRCPVPEMIDAGVTVGLGTDGPGPQNSFDLFLDMKMAIMHQRLHARDAFVMPPGKVLEMVTIDAARAIGRERELGSIEVGKRADVITVDWSKPHLQPRLLPVQRLVYYATGQDVDTVIVDGRVVMEGRVVQTVDVGDVVARAEEETTKVMKRAELHRLLDQPQGFWGSARY